MHIPMRFNLSHRKHGKIMKDVVDDEEDMDMKTLSLQLQDQMRKVRRKMEV